MWTYIARRLLWLPVILFAASLITFAFGRFGPGDPVEVMLGESARPADLAALRAALGLDQPVLVQLVRYFEGLARLDLGVSLYSQRPITDLLRERIPATVTLAAAADPGSVFTGWSGAGCTGTGLCLVTISQAETLTATFSLNPTYTLTVSVVGTGSGSITGTGISCPGDCTEDYADGTWVTLIATTPLGSNFVGWSGAGCSGIFSCNIQMTQLQNVTATFEAEPPKLLSISLNGDGGGTVTSNPAGIDCGTDCMENYLHGTVVTLVTTPDPDSYFANWTDCAPSSITMTADTACEGIFHKKGTTSRSSIDSGGAESNDRSTSPAISGDGRDRKSVG